MATQREVDLLDECIGLEVRLLLAKYQQATGQDDCTLMALVRDHANALIPEGC